jgi:hypothetical protein
MIESEDKSCKSSNSCISNKDDIKNIHFKKPDINNNDKIGKPPLAVRENSATRGGESIART